MNLMFWKRSAASPGRDAGQEAQTMESANDTSAPAEAAGTEGEPAAAPVETACEPAGGPAPDGVPVLEHAGRIQLENRVIEAISGVFDPEIPVNIYELGLIYDIEVTPQADVVIEMTLTSPACPVAGSLPGDVETAVSGIEGVRAVDVHLVWDPPWTPDRMTEAARLELGFM